MLDERWSPEVEEIATVLRRMLAAESKPERVRAAEAAGGADAALEAELAAFGLNELEGAPDLFARIAYELGWALAPTSYVETMPVLALTGRAGVAFGFDGLAPAGAAQVAVRREDGVYAENLAGTPRKTAAGDTLVSVLPTGNGARLGDSTLADRIARFAKMTNSARLIGAGQALLAYGADYTRQREQFGKMIGSYQGVAHRLSRVAGELDAAELLLRKAAFTACAEYGGDGAPSEAFALMLEAKAIAAARAVSTNIHQVFGGNGFAMEYDVQLFSRRLRNWAMRHERPGASLAALGRLVLDPVRRDSLRLLWHYEEGMPLPRWATEADSL
jgi:Acyl-CoA dehydrogenase, C-terminal domain